MAAAEAMKKGRYTPRGREVTQAPDYCTSYKSMCQRSDSRRSPIPPGYTGHKPGNIFNFGFGNPDAVKLAGPGVPQFDDDRLSGIQARCDSGVSSRFPFDALKIGAGSAWQSYTPRPGTSGTSPRPGSCSPRKSDRPETCPPGMSRQDVPFFRAQPPPTPTPKMGFKAEEFPEEVQPVEYLKKKGQPTHFWPYYRPLDGQHCTGTPGAQYPPHPPDTKEQRDMRSSYATSFMKKLRKTWGGGKDTAVHRTPRGTVGGYEHNFTPLTAAWMGDEDRTDSLKTSYRGTFTKAAASPVRRKMRPC